MKKFILRLVTFLLPVLIIILPLPIIGLISGELIPFDMIIKKQRNNHKILVGMAYNEQSSYYKLKNANYYQSDVIALGTSRVMQFNGEYFNGNFYNCGGGVDCNFDQYLNFLKNLNYTPKIIILGMDQWIFNEAWRAGNGDNSDFEEIKYTPVPTRTILHSLGSDYSAGKWNFKDLNNYPQNYGFNGVIKNNGFRWDGSYYYGDVYRNIKNSPKDRLLDSLNRIDNGLGRFEWGKSLSMKTIKNLQGLLTYCADNGIEVIGFLPPYAPSVYFAMMASGNYKYITLIPSTVENIFSEYDYLFINYSDGAILEVSDEYFIDGFHGSEIVYDLIVQDIVSKTNNLNAYVNENKLKSLFENRYSNLAFYKAE